MKFILLSDLHLVWDRPVGRKDDIQQTQIDKLKFVLQKASKLQAMVLQAGDFFHRPRNWYLLSQVIDLLDRLRFKDINIGAVFGQHDTYMRSQTAKSATSLGVLCAADYIYDLEVRPVIFENSKVAVHGAGYGREIPEPLEDYLNILVIHSPISDKAIYPGQDYIPASKFLKEQQGYDLILCGDIHRHFFVEDGMRCIVNTGPILRLEANDYNFEHQPKIGIYDTEDRSVIFEVIPHSPAEEVLTREHIEAKLESDNMLNDFIGAIQNKTLNKMNFEDNLWEFIRTNSIDKPVEELIRRVINDTDK